MITTDDVTITPSCGNIFADLGLPDADLLLAKAKLGLKISRIIKERKLPQAKAAKLMSLTQPNVSDLLRGRPDGFTLDRLFRCLDALGRNRDRRAPQAQSHRDSDTGTRGIAPVMLPWLASLCQTSFCVKPVEGNTMQDKTRLTPSASEAHKPNSRQQWQAGAAALCFSLVGSVFVLAGCSGPSPAGLPPAAAYLVVLGDQELFPLAGIGLLIILPGLLFSVVKWRSLGGKIGVVIPLVVFAWLAAHHGRTG